jgi:cysteinyl-tRNA synthetase
MLQLYDGRSRRLEEVLPASSRLLRVYACGPVTGRGPHVGELRTLLLTDLVRRTAELGGARVLLVQGIDDAGAGPGGAPSGEDAFPRDLAALNIYPADAYLRSSDRIDPAQQLGGSVDVWIGGDPRTGVARHWVRAGQVLVEGRDPGGTAGDPVLLPDVTGRGHDPLALRLAFLEHRYRDPLDLTWDAVEAAGRTLAGWRRRVAEWAESPSAPMRTGYVRQARDAFEQDLDTPAALAALHQVEQDPEVTAGSKFEIFAHLDRLFGLDLVVDVGKPR